MMYLIQIGREWLASGDTLTRDKSKAEIFVGSATRAETLRDRCELRFRQPARLVRYTQGVK